MKTEKGPANTISERLQQLREAQQPKLTQPALAKRIGSYQVWLSRRETGEVEPTVSEAVRIAAGIGYAAELLIVDLKYRELLVRLSSVNPENATPALRLAAVFQHFDETSRVILEGLLKLAEDKAAEVSSDRKAL